MISVWNLAVAIGLRDFANFDSLIRRAPICSCCKTALMRLRAARNLTTMNAARQPSI
jgi:hypothetical protein